MNIEKDLTIFNDIVRELLTDEAANPVTEVIDPIKLFDIMDLSLSDEPVLDDEFISILRNLILHTPKTATKRFFNQLFGGRQSRAVLGDLLAVMLNTSMYTYKVAGPQVFIEKTIIKQICSKIGYNDKSGGTFPTGGSMSNFMAIVMARDAFDSQIIETGMHQALVAYSSEDSHYSIAKNAAFIGMGRKNIRYIPVNAKGEMVAQKLEKQIAIDKKAGLSPFFVNATAGTTVMGAYDPIKEIAAVCEQHNLWLHVDAVLGGAVLFSETYHYLLDGVKQADSFSINAHKMLGVPLTCSILVVKDEDNLYHSFSNDADYLYQHHHDDLNPGKTSLQCGRRNDALKFWTLWKSIGTLGLQEMVDYQFRLTEVAMEYMGNHSDYTTYNQSPAVTACFNYKNIDPKALCTALYDQQEMVIGYGSHHGIKFIRLVTVNTNNTEEELLQFFTILEQFVEREGNTLPTI